MSEWVDRRLGDHIGTLPGFAFVSKYFNDRGEGLPLIRIRDIEASTTAVHYSGPYPSAFVVSEGDMLVGMDGEFNLRRWKGDKALLNQRVLKVFAKPSGEIDLNFAYYWLAPYLKKVEASTAATTVKHLSSKDVEKAVVHSPCKDMQAAIARILRALDTQIEATEGLIAKQERVRAGLMQDLFTRGVDEHGQLRPPRHQAPHLYHQTELGWLPVGWGVDRITKCINSPSDATIGPFGSNLVASDYRNAGVPVIFVRDVKPDRFFWKSDVFVDPAKANSLAAHSSQPGDVIATKMGFPPCIACLHPRDFPAAIITADMIRLRVSRRDVAIPEYISGALNSEAVLAQVRAITGGVTRPKVTLADFRSLRLAYPPVDEQKLIFERLALIDGLIDKQLGEVAKMNLQKSGLMQDLLTGKVSVAPLLEAVPA